MPPRPVHSHKRSESATQGGSMNVLTIPIGGMSCDNCVREVGQALRRVSGVRSAEVRIGSATVSYDPAVAMISDMTSAIRQARYEPLV